MEQYTSLLYNSVMHNVSEVLYAFPEGQSPIGATALNKITGILPNNFHRPF